MKTFAITTLAAFLFFAGSACAQDDAAEKIHVTTDLVELPAAERERVRRLLSGDAALWTPRSESDLVTVLGAENGEGESTGELSVELGLVDPASRAWIEPYLDHLAEFEAWLPLPPDLPAAALGPKRSTLLIADVIWRGGTRSGSNALSTFLPRDRSNASANGRTYVIWRNLLERRWYDLEIAPAVPLILTAEQRPLATAASHLRFYATRFTTYQLGPQNAATEGGRVGLRERFGDLWGSLVIAKADLLGTLAHEWLIAEGLEPPETSHENLAMLVVMAFRALADVTLGEAPPPHEAASTLQLSFFLAHGAVEYDISSAHWRFDAEKMRLAARQLVEEIFAIHASGDVERARRLFERYADFGGGELDGEVAATLDRVAAFGASETEVTFEITGLEPGERRMVLTFDDLPAQRAPHLPEARIREITEKLVALLEREEIPAIGFVNENKLEIEGAVDPGRIAHLEQWLDAGLELGNHSYSHPDLHRVALDDFERDVAKGERVTRPLVESRGSEWRYFRHPFLHTGRDLETKRAFERFLDEREYRLAPVTIDNSEWIFARAYDEALDRDDAALAARLGGAYVDYMERMVVYYEGQSRALFEREIPQVLLLHANAVNAHYLEPLVERLRERGYRFIDLDTALEDEAYSSPDTYIGPGGITWLHRWAITRGVDRSIFRGEPATPEWVQEVAGIRE